MRSLVDAHVLVTGGAAGIGLALARECLVRGARVSLVDVSDGAGAVAQLKAECGATARVACARADVADYAQVKAAVDAASAELGPVAVVVPNAGIAGKGLLLEDEEVHAHSRVLAVNYLGVYHTVKACLPGMLARRSGHVLFIGSLMAMYGAFAGGSYCAAKAAVRGLADSLRLELLGTGVGVSISLPGLVDTPLAHQGQDNPQSPQLAKLMLAEMKASAVPAAQVAKLALDAVQQGRYIARATSFGMALATAPGATIHPRLLPIWLELLLAPLSTLMPWLFGRSLSKRIREWRKGGSDGL